MDADQSTAVLGLSEAADMAGCSRDTIRRAAQKGDLKGEMGSGARGPQWWIKESDLLAWMETRDSLEQSTAAKDAQQSTAAKHAQQSMRSKAQQPKDEADFAEAEWLPHDDAQASPVTTASPPAEVYIALIDRLSRSERRAIELEIQLRQSNRLLTENAESITEKDAIAKEAQAKLQVMEDAKQIEIPRLATELTASQAAEAQARAAEMRFQEVEQARSAELAKLQTELASTRQQLLEANQKPKGLFSWLGFRKNRTANGQVDKAV